MDNSFDRYSSEIPPTRDLFGGLEQFYKIIRAWLVASFVVTEEEKINAGIYLGRLRDDE